MAAGQWGTIEIQVPDFLEPIRDAINFVAEFLVAVLDIVLAALQLVKAYLVGFLDPILAFLQQIIDYITTLLRDLRQLGLYITGDWKQLEYPFGELRGGYQAYEQRMIARMADRTDPTRPDLSANTKMFSLWFYLSVDISDIERLIEFVRQLMQFFGHRFNPVGTPPIPSITSVTYNADAISILQPQVMGEYFKKNLGLPSVAVVKWKVNSTASTNLFNPFPALPPDGFIVTVSTFPDGIPVFYDRPQGGAGTHPSAYDSTKRVQPRDSGRVYGPTSQPLVLHGGAEMLAFFGDQYGYNASMNKGVVKPNRTRAYGVLSPSARTVVPLEFLETSGWYNFQRTFYVSSAMRGTQFMSGEFQLALSLNDMPRSASIVANPDGTMSIVPSEEHTSLVYVRVASCTKNVANQNPRFKYDFTTLASAPSPTSLVWRVATTVPANSVSPFSAPARVLFPNANTVKYFEAVQTALIILALCRPDFQTLAEILPNLPQETRDLIEHNKLILRDIAAKPCGLETFQHLVGFVFKDPAKEYAAKGVFPLEFRQHVFDKTQQLVYDLYDKTGPMPDVERSVVLRTEKLRCVKMSELSVDVPSNLRDYTLLQMFNTSQGGQVLDSGFALNRYSMGVPEDISDQLLDQAGVYQMRTPQFMEAPMNPTDDSTFDVGERYFPTDAAYQTALEAAGPGLKIIYEHAQRDPAGGWIVPSEYLPFLDRISRGGMQGSADDDAPVFYINRSGLNEGFTPVPSKRAVLFARGMLTDYRGGQLLSEALFALSAAGSVVNRSPKDGEWLAYRFMDSLVGIEDFLWALENWLQSIKNAIQSIIDTIRKYIEYLEARIIEMQQFIRRINDLIQSILQNIFVIPKCSAMMLYSNGTGGMLADFVAAKNKPADSPLAFGAGVGVVFPIPLIGLIGDILMALFNTDAEAPDGIAGPLPPPAVIPNPPQPIDPVEPDVL